MNDERHKKNDTLTSTVLQEALHNMPLSVILECEAPRSTQRNLRPASTFYPSGRSSTAHGSERAGRVHSVVAVEAKLKEATTDRRLSMGA
jgi:hypothetical protein